MGRLSKVDTAVQEGNLKARAEVRNSGDELDELGAGLNTMLDRLEGSTAAIRHARDALAHVLTTPPTLTPDQREGSLVPPLGGKIQRGIRTGPRAGEGGAPQGPLADKTPPAAPAAAPGPERGAAAVSAGGADARNG